MVPGFIRSPFVHFCAIGVLLFCLELWRSDNSVGLGSVAQPEREAIVVPAERVGVRLESFVEREVLYREALLRGLHLNDYSIRYRMTEKMRFLLPGTKDSEKELYRKAVEMDLGRDDVVVKGILAEKMRRIIMVSADITPPTDAELEAFMRRKRARFEQPATVSFSHLFFSRQKRGSRVKADATAALEALRSGGAAPGSDPFPHNREFAGSSPNLLAKLFGPEFTQQMFSFKPVQTGHWQGPVPSAYGLHLVLLSSLTEGRLPEVDSVRRQVELGLDHELRKHKYDEVLRQLRGLYQVKVESEPGGQNDAG